MTAEEYRALLDTDFSDVDIAEKSKSVKICHKKSDKLNI